MKKAVICPVCEGKGIVSPVFYDTRHGYYTSVPMIPELCRSCSGKGWVEVSGDSPIAQPVHDITKCPACGGQRSEPALTGCPKGSHYGAYCEA